MAKRKTGPKKRPRHELKTRAVLVKFAEGEYSHLQAAAQGRPLAAYLREKGLQ